MKIKALLNHGTSAAIDWLIANQDDFELVSNPPFRVKVSVMEDSHQTTYWVCLDRGDRPADAKPWDDGRITPFRSKIREHAEIEAAKWAEFLGVEVTE